MRVMPVLFLTKVSVDLQLYSVEESFPHHKMNSNEPPNDIIDKIVRITKSSTTSKSGNYGCSIKGENFESYIV